MPSVTSPIAVSEAPPAATAARAPSRSAGAQGGQQLVVLATRRDEVDRVRLPPRPPPRRLRAAPEPCRARWRSVTPLAAATWSASPPRPSLRSIIDVAPPAASARPAASRGDGVSWRRRSASAADASRRVGELGAVEQQQAGRRPAELAGDDHDVPRLGAGARDELIRRAGVADHGHRQEQDRRPGHVAADDRHPVRRRGCREARAEVHRPRLVQVGGDAQLHVCLTRGSAHRGEIGEGGRERLVANGPERGRLPAEVDALDERIDRRRGHAGRLGDGRVIAASDHDRARRARAARRPSRPARRAGRSGRTPPMVRSRSTVVYHQVAY